jgi:hypothetical protein
VAQQHAIQVIVCPPRAQWKRCCGKQAAGNLIADRDRGFAISGERILTACCNLLSR